MTRPILQRFRQLWPLDLGLAGEIGQGAGHLDHPVQGAQGQIQAFARAFQPALIGLAQGADLVQLIEAEQGVGTPLARQLEGPGFGHLARGLRRREFTGR